MAYLAPKQVVAGGEPSIVLWNRLVENQVALNTFLALTAHTQTNNRLLVGSGDGRVVSTAIPDGELVIGGAAGVDFAGHQGRTGTQLYARDGVVGWE